MTTRREAETVLFATCQTDKFESTAQIAQSDKPEDVTHMGNVSLPENVKTVPMGNKTQICPIGQKRRRVRTLCICTTSGCAVLAAGSR